MRDHFSDDAFVAGDAPDRLIPEAVRRMAGAAVFLGLVAAMGLWSYRLGTRDAAAVPVIRAMEGPARLQPEEPGGLEAAHQGLEVNAVLAGQPAPVPREGPPPVPPPTALAEEDGPQGELIMAAPARLVADALASGELRMPAGEEGPEAVEVAPVPEFAPLPSEGPAAAAPSELAALPEAEAPSPRPRVRPARRVETALAPAPTPAPAAEPDVREVSRVAPGSRLVQLGAFDSEEIARQAWSALVGRNGDLLGPKSLYVERTTNNARVFYRLRVAGFENTEETRVMCEALRARGVACIPVTLQ